MLILRFVGHREYMVSLSLFATHSLLANAYRLQEHHP